MILNPVISGGAEEKVYKITDNAGIMLDGEYLAGEIVTSRELVPGTISIKAADGTIIPFSEDRSNRVTYLFVMPAQDITITNGGGVIT